MVVAARPDVKKAAVEVRLEFRARGSFEPPRGLLLGTKGLEGVAQFARFWTVLVDGLFPGAEPGLFVMGT